MSCIKAVLVALLVGPLSLACGSDASFGDVEIELCSSLAPKATSVEVFATLDALGGQNLTDQRVSVSDGFSALPSLAWNGAGFAVAWEDARDGLLSIYLAQLSTLGVKAAPEFSISGGGSYSSRSVALTTIGNDYAAVWSDSRTGNSEIRYADISSTGAFSGSTALTDTGAGAFEPSLVRASSQTRVIW